MGHLYRGRRDGVGPAFSALWSSVKMLLDDHSTRRNWQARVISNPLGCEFGETDRGNQKVFSRSISMLRRFSHRNRRAADRAQWQCSRIVVLMTGCFRVGKSHAPISPVLAIPVSTELMVRPGFVLRPRQEVIVVQIHGCNLDESGRERHQLIEFPLREVSEANRKSPSQLQKTRRRRFSVPGHSVSRDLLFRTGLSS